MTFWPSALAFAPIVIVVGLALSLSIFETYSQLNRPPQPPPSSRFTATSSR